MPYATNADLPPSVKRRLPEHAQDIYREAFNHDFAARPAIRARRASHRISGAQSSDPTSRSMTIGSRGARPRNHCRKKDMS
jgi:cation transport regulator